MNAVTVMTVYDIHLFFLDATSSNFGRVFLLLFV